MRLHASGRRRLVVVVAHSNRGGGDVVRGERIGVPFAAHARRDRQAASVIGAFVMMVIGAVCPGSRRAACRSRPAGRTRDVRTSSLALRHRTRRGCPSRKEMYAMTVSMRRLPLFVTFTASPAAHRPCHVGLRRGRRRDRGSASPRARTSSPRRCSTGWDRRPRNGRPRAA